MRIRAAAAGGAVLLGLLGTPAVAHEMPKRDYSKYYEDYGKRFEDYNKRFDEVAKKIKAMCPEGDMIILPLSVMDFHITICLPSGEVRV